MESRAVRQGAGPFAWHPSFRVPFQTAHRRFS
jgi:hypothetical protein